MAKTGAWAVLEKKRKAGTMMTDWSVLTVTGILMVRMCGLSRFIDINLKNV